MQVKNEIVDPALTFPSFPDPFDGDGQAIPKLEGENVVIPQWYWSKITEYVIDVEKVREIYEGWQSVYLPEIE